MGYGSFGTRERNWSNIEPFIMGFGGRGGGEGSSRPDEGGSKGKKARLSADDIHRIVAQHRKQVMHNPNWKKIPRLLSHSNGCLWDVSH